MKRWIICWLALWLLLVGQGAYATISCTVSGTTSTPVYDPFGASNNDSSQAVTVVCTRVGGDGKFPSSFPVTVAGANGSRTLTSGGNTVNFELYTVYTACSTAWQGATAIAESNTGGTSGGTTSINLSQTFCFRIPSGQSTTKPGTYNGNATLAMNWTDSGGTVHNDSGTLSLSATVNAACSFTTAPGAMTLNYTSLSATAATGTSNFALRCTNSTPYTLALDQTSVTDNAVNLDYTLALSASSGTGSGAAQSYTITGTMAAGQVGTCASASCTNTAATNKTRTLTITY